MNSNICKNCSSFTLFQDDRERVEATCDLTTQNFTFCSFEIKDDLSNFYKEIKKQFIEGKFKTKNAHGFKVPLECPFYLEHLLEKEK